MNEHAIREFHFSTISLTGRQDENDMFTLYPDKQYIFARVRVCVCVWGGWVHGCVYFTVQCVKKFRLPDILYSVHLMVT